MKRFAALLLLLLTLASPLLLSSCSLLARGPIPNGTYETSYGTKIVIKGSTMKEYIVEDNIYSVAISYDYALNESETEITMTFKEYLMGGNLVEAANFIQHYENGLENSGMDIRGTQTASFEQGEGYIIINLMRYDLKKD